jgi:hypothetical protein
MSRSWVWVWAVVSLASSLGACAVTEHRTSSDAGAAGEGSVPSNLLVEQIRQERYEQLDLLFVVDNSAGMADKQALLAQAVPPLVQRLATPLCVDSEGNPTGDSADASGVCADGRSEFLPLHDIHIGVVSSSLGSHGAAGPDDACTSSSEDDHGQLLGRVRGQSETWNDLGFLAWDARASSSPPGDADQGVFADKLAAMLTSAGETGCRYPATLEAWYRFLIDPEPPLRVVVEAGGSEAVRQGIDDTLLEQRAAFLRPSSIVAIVMLSDKNDCSVQDEGYGWLVARASAMYRSTSQCLSNPNDKCCQSCGEALANEGCPAIATDPECAKGTSLSAAEDAPRLRCYAQKRRFGFDLLYPTSRYVDALRSPVVSRSSDQELVQNPLYAAREGKAPRDQGVVFLAGIVGVPWQDVADEASFAGAELTYLTAAELASKRRWDVILGDPGANPPVFPTDPLMVETTHDRTTLPIPQVNPITLDFLVPSTSTDPQANHINGHEHANVDDSELQYACTFPLPMARPCEPAEAGVSCACGPDEAERHGPLCQPPGAGAAGTLQYNAQAYPGIRHLQVLKDFGENSIVASVCPKVSQEDQTAFGYNPAMEALVRRIKEALVARCLPRQLYPAADGRVPCRVIEAMASDGPSCNCPAPRAEVAASIARGVRNKMQNDQLCGTELGASCSSFCLCELPQLSGGALRACQNDARQPEEPGFCYLNAQPDEMNVGAPELVADCSADSQRLLRFGGDGLAPGSTAFLVCEPAVVIGPSP